MNVSKTVQVVFIIVAGCRGALSSGGYEDMSRLLKTILKDYNPVVSPCLDAQTPVRVEVALRVSAIIGLTILKDYNPVVSPCPDAQTPVRVEVALRVSAIIGLTILKDYNPVLFPCPDAETPVRVEVAPRVSAIIHLSIKEQTLTIRGHHKFSWFDTRLTWDPEEFGGIRFTNLPQDYAYRPDMVMSSLQGDFYLGAPQTQVIIFSNGSVVWEPSFTSTFACQVHISKYPVDDSECSIDVGPWANYNTSFVMDMQENAIHIEDSAANGQFYVSAGSAHITVFSYDEWFFELAKFKLRLTRKPNTAILSLLFPMQISGLLGPVAFLIPPDDAEKVSVAVTVLLATAVFMGVVHDNLPDKSDEASIVAIYVSLLLILAFLSVLGNTIVLMIHRKDTEQDQTPTGFANDGTYLNNFENNLNALHSTLKLHGKDAKIPNTSPKIVYSETSFPDSTGKFGGNDVKVRPRPRSRAEKLNRFLFISNSAAIVFITLAVVALIFG